MVKLTSLPLLPRTKLHTVTIRGGGDTLGAPVDQCYASWEWMATLGAPSALVGGAAIASFFELRERLLPEVGDSNLTRAAKSACLLLLLSSFACEISCVFIGQVTGDALQSNGDTPQLSDGTAGSFLGEDWGYGMDRADCFAFSPLGMMHREMEFEYLASRVGFFQGILQWILAISLELAVSGASFAQQESKQQEINEDEKLTITLRCRKYLCYAASAATCSLTLWMIAFYNWHLPFYRNYFHMLSRLVGLSWKRYIWRGFRPSAMTGSSSSASLRDDSKEKLRFTALVALVPLVASAIFTFFAFVPTLTSRRKKSAASWRIGTPRQSPLSLSEAHMEFAVVSASETETEGGSELER